MKDLIKLSTIIFIFSIFTSVHAHGQVGGTPITLNSISQHGCNDMGYTVMQVDLIFINLNRAYSRYLGRNPDKAGLHFYACAVMGGESLTSILRDLRSSPEAQINGFYLRYLGRNADSAGRSFWMGKYRAGLSLSKIARSIANSSEAQARNSNTANLRVETTRRTRYYRRK